MREVRRRLSELKKENEELRNLLSISGKNHHEYEIKVNISLLSKPSIHFSLIRFNS
jgi:ubiquitin C-terminal hydrolase